MTGHGRGIAMKVPRNVDGCNIDVNSEEYLSFGVQRECHCRPAGASEQKARV